MTRVQGALFLFAAADLVCATLLGLMDHGGVAGAMVGTTVPILLVAAVGPDSILSLVFGDFELKREAATDQEIEVSVAIAEEEPDVPSARIAEVTQTAEARPENERTDADYLVLAMAAHREKNPEQVLQYAYVGLSLPSSGWRVRATLTLRVATAFGELGLHDRALALFRQTIEMDPTFAWPHSNRGLTLVTLKRHEEALAAYDEAIQLDPEYVHAHNNRGRALNDLKRHEEALAAYDEAIRLDPEYVHAHHNRGIALRQLGRTSEATAALARAKELGLE